MRNVTEPAELRFTSLNPYGEDLDYIEASSPEGLRDQIRKIRLPTRILSIYASEGKHIAWVLTTAKLTKKRI